MERRIESHPGAFGQPVNKAGIFFFFICFLTVLTGCKDEEAPYLNLSVSEIDFTQKAQEQTVDIHANTPWQASISPATASSWLTLNANSGNGGNATLTLRVTANSEFDDRTAEIIFKSAAEIQTLTITQHKKEVMELLSDKEWYVWQAGGTLTEQKIQKNVDYTIEIAENAKSWIRQVTTKGLVTDELAFEIDENIAPQIRYGEIYFRGKGQAEDAGNSLLADTIKITQQELSLTVDKERLDFGQSNQKKWIRIVTTHQKQGNNNTTVPDYTVGLPAEGAAWCSVRKSPESDEYLVIEVQKNDSGQDRETDLTISSSILTETIHITQKASLGITYNDGDIVNIQSHGAGNGVHLIIMGDGFTRTDLEHDGYYETTMRQAAEYFFSIEPFRSYRHYFDVDMVVAESEEEGVNDTSGSSPTVKNKFNSTFGQGTNITCDLDLCQRYVARINGIDTTSAGQVTTQSLVILALNSSRYAGTTTLYSNGFCVAICPMSTLPSPNDFEGLIHHEAGGHGFGLLEDEYVYYNGTIPASDKAIIQSWQQIGVGFYPNVDFTNVLARIRWSEFTGQDGYSHVGAYPGAAMYSAGIWRPEEISCMDTNIPYYNAPSRRAIINRILRLAGEPELSFAEFAAADNVTPWATSKSGAPYKAAAPLGRPRRMMVN